MNNFLQITMEYNSAGGSKAGWDMSTTFNLSPDSSS